MDPPAQSDETTPREPAPSAQTPDLRALWLLAGLLPLVALAYVLITGHEWEDFFITYRHSRNFAEGHGLLYHAGERLHGFTSPINVVVPALLASVLGTDHVLPLWGFRLLSILTLVAGAGYFVRYLAREGVSLPAQVVFVLLLSFEIKTIAYATNGQEAGFWVGCLLPGLVSVLAGTRHTWKLAGLCWGGLLWSRPDGCIYIAALGIAALLFAPREQRREELVACLKAAAVCTAVYLPWFLGAWIYYGTPVPHTIVAKGQLTQSQGLLQQLSATFLGSTRQAGECFQPLYANCWSLPFRAPGALISLFCLGYWLFPEGERRARVCSGLYALCAVYVGYLSSRAPVVFPWYLPPLAALGCATLAMGLPDLARRWGRPRLGWAACGACVLYLATTFAAQTYQIRVQQRVIEWNHRKQIGLWLKERVQPGERVFLECLGYIGYYSEARMLDFPGLVSPDTVAVLREHGPSMAKAAWALQPEWMVLRPHEAKAILAVPELERDYRVAQLFDARSEIPGWLPGRPYLANDAVFLVLRRRRQAAQPPSR